MSPKHRLLSCGLVLLCVLLALLLAAFIAVSAVVMESHTYKRAAKNEAYLDGVENTVIGIMKEASAEEGLPKAMLLQHVQSDDIRKLAKKNAADAALVLKGSQVIYGQSFNEAALQLDIYQFYEQQLPEAEAATDGNGDANTQTSGNAGLFSKTQEDPARAELREKCDELAAEISADINTAVRVIDMEQVAYDASKGGLLDWLRFMGRGGVLLPLLLLALGLLVLYRLTWERGFSPWLAGVSICSGIILLICAILIPAGGWLDLSVEPVQLAILYETILKGILAELIVMSLLWLFIGYLAIRVAIGKPVSTKWLRALFARLRPAAGKGSGDAGSLENTTVSSESPNDDASSGVSDNTDNRSANGAHKTSVNSNAALLQTIKKAAADSTNSLLGRKKR